MVHLWLNCYYTGVSIMVRLIVGLIWNSARIGFSDRNYYR
jgi:hypothetical protein